MADTTHKNLSLLLYRNTRISFSLDLSICFSVYECFQSLQQKLRYIFFILIKNTFFLVSFSCTTGTRQKLFHHIKCFISYKRHYQATLAMWLH